ncbi:MAG: hypothetical protein GX950_01440 [Candidatus Diapherotrites archaeon]|jgi:hypothetical protein|uniref:Uncharacterized protein n=1 Tax=Candidatus Iainarchaeum sp. TaxID=3101447 RepID=A0A7K4BZF5_9ARCH|nr:hypothetical protein [Candidatus Diapherotrites archaeon]
MGFVINLISRRKVIYPFFVIMICLVILTLIFLFFFTKPLEVYDSSISVSGENLILTLGVENVSNHLVKDIEVVVLFGGEKKFFKLKPENNFLLPGETYSGLYEVPIVDSNLYDVVVQSPFNRPAKLFFELEESTLKPVRVDVLLPENMVVGKKYDVVYKLCNVSNNNLHDVSWLETVDKRYFSGDYFLKTISLNVNECINLYSTLTPIKSGESRISFLLKVGALEQKLSQEVVVGE